MTICPFMSRPVVGLHDTKLRPVDCQREKCAAWGPVEPLWVIERVDGKDSDQYITFHGGKWKRIPRRNGHDLILCGCRRLGFEVPE